MTPFPPPEPPTSSDALPADAITGKGLGETHRLSRGQNILNYRTPYGEGKHSLRGGAFALGMGGAWMSLLISITVGCAGGLKAFVIVLVLAVLLLLAFAFDVDRDERRGFLVGLLAGALSIVGVATLLIGAIWGTNGYK